MRKQYILEKPKGRTRIEIVCCDEEGWFYAVNRTESKTGKLKHTGMIVQKEVPMWIDSYTREGYKLIVEKDI